MCWVTENGLPNGPNGAADVDGGATTLTSPAMPILGDGYPVLSYYFAYSNNVTTQIDDTMPVLVSPDGGQSWTEIELVSEPTYGWARRVVYIHELFEDAQSVTLRFVARDEDAGSVVEAAVDDVRLEMLRCLPRLDGDANTDGVVNFADLNIVLNAFGAQSDIPGEFPADLNRDGAVDFVDLNMVLNTFGEHI